MPVPLQRNGNVYIERASFSKTHGATPTQCSITFEAVCNVPLGLEFRLDIGGSVWSGFVVEQHVHKSESVGQVTELTCHDVRELLMSQSAFCQLNMIDHKTGAIYCILDDDFVDALVDLGYISQRDANYEYGKWEFLHAFSYWDVIYPQTVINVLCYLCGYLPPIFSTQTRAILNAAATASNAGIQATLFATNNFFGINWQMGEKCGSALQHIADLLGLHFTLVPGEKRLTFYRIGEPSYEAIEWQGVFAPDTTQGTSLQLNVDTGVWITGERDVWEMNNVDLVPAWNQNWNRWGLKQKEWVEEHILKPAGMDLFTLISELKDLHLVIEVNYVYGDTFLQDGVADGQNGNAQPAQLDLSTLYDPGFTEAGFFEDLPIYEYLDRVFFKVYRIGIMDQFLTPDEFNGRDSAGNRVPVRFKPIHTPLLSDPSVPYHCYGTTIKKHSKRHRISVSPPRTRMEKGHRMSDETGHIVFDEMQYAETDDAIQYSIRHQGHAQPPNGIWPNVPTNIVPSAPAVDVCFYGPVFRQFYGNAKPYTESGVLIMPRIGTKKVPGLRHGKVLLDASAKPLTPWAERHQTVAQYMAKQPEYLLNPDMEFLADTQAMLVANSWLNRPHVVRSGQENGMWYAGHEPDGEIRRVSVSVDGKNGISESVTYANDYPSLFHEPDIALSRQMAVDAAIRRGDRLKQMQLSSAYHQLQAADATNEAKPGFDVFHAKRVVINQELDVGMVE